MTKYPLMTSFIAACMTLAATGCGSVIRASIDTQPRVDVASSSVDRPEEIVHGRPVAYVLGKSAPDCDADLAKYSPIIVQGFQSDRENAEYDYWSDGIGRPVEDSVGAIRVDPAVPVVFGRVEHASLYGATLKQLTYVYWYPSRDVGSVETGEVDGGILRITLDAAGHPAVFEFSQTCGCYHGVFAARGLEQQSQQEFGDPPQSRCHALEAPASCSEWIVRDVVDAAPDQQPVLYISAGDHFCELLRFVDRGQPLHAPVQRSYNLEPYEQLEAIPSDSGQTVSMFNEDKLVRGAKRWKEELLFSDINHPGWPRHLDVMFIHWDHDRWTDPTLLERHLRMPHAAAGRDIPPPQTAQAQIDSTK